MIEIALSYGDALWLLLLYIIGSFLRGIGTGLGMHLRKRRDDKKILTFKRRKVE